MNVFWCVASVALGLALGIAYVHLTGADAYNRQAWRQRQKAIAITNKRLEEIWHEYAHDPSQLHRRADGCVAGLLIQSGYVQVVDKWEELIMQKPETAPTNHFQTH